jgi:hypothetical protein
MREAGVGFSKRMKQAMFSLHGLIRRTWGRDFFEAGALLNPRSIFSHQWFLYLGGFFLHPGRSCIPDPICVHQFVLFEFFSSHFFKRQTSFSQSGFNCKSFLNNMVKEPCFLEIDKT